MVMSRSGTPTWIAARPMPGASYMVSSMSSASSRISGVTASTGLETSRRLLVRQDDDFTNSHDARM